MKKMFGAKLFSWRLKLPPEFRFMGTALIVGIGTGLGAVAFRYLISFVEFVGFDWFPQLTSRWGNAYVIIIPVIGGLIVGPLIYYFAREAKGHGVPEVMEAVALQGGRIRPVVAVVKSLASSISIGSGGSVGREGPIVQIGSAIGSTLGQRLKLSDDRIRNLVACGAAGGIAATFNAPIAGVFFALEIILGEFSVRYFSSVVVSAIAASVIGRAVFGDIPAFIIPFEYGMNSPWEFLFYPLLGVFAAIMGVIFVRTLYWSEDVFEKGKMVPEWLRPAIGGLLLGIVALVYPVVSGVSWDRMPQIFNVGYKVIENALASELTLAVVLILLVLKLIATSLTLGSGGSGGVFAPSLFMGAMLGTAFEIIVNRFFPGIAAPPGAYALVGMGAVFAASAHAPITAVLILFELTGDYHIILPLMLTVVIATLFAQWLLGGESIYSLKLTRRGVHIQRGRDVDVMQSVFVNEIMVKDFHTITDDMNLKEFSEVIYQSHRNGIMVLDNNGKLWGVVTIRDLEQAINKQLSLELTPISAIATHRDQMLLAYPDETMGDVLNSMSFRGIGRLPVVSRDDTSHLLGVIRRDDIIRAYKIAMTRRAEIQHQTKRIQNIDGTEYVDLQLIEGDNAVGESVNDLAKLIPEEFVLVSIKRNEKVIIPHGATLFQAGDYITAFIQSRDAELFYKYMRDGSPKQLTED